MLHYIVHYAEIALKGQNRADFEKQLAQNIRQQHPGCRVERLNGRMIVSCDEPIDLGNVFGIAWWAQVVRQPAELEVIGDCAVATAEANIGEAASFAVRVQRADKSFPLNSQQLEVEVGARLDELLPIPVNLDQPEFTLGIEIADGEAFVYHQRHEGYRGLPAGSSGKLVGLFSAGIDSAVAAWLMGKRGADIELVHFHVFADGEQADRDKPGRLGRSLAKYFPGITIHYVPYHHFQVATMDLKRHQRQELVVFRRFMARTAARLAAEAGALGLFSGDNLGQVASQTLQNLAAVDAALDMSLYRPLIAYDKQEIIDLGVDLGLYDIANEQYKDCCSIIARHPATVARMEQIASIEHEIEIDSLIEASLAEVLTKEFGPEPELATPLRATS